MLHRISVALIGMAAAMAAAAAPQPIDSIVAVVNDQVVLRSELERAIDQVRRQYQGRVNLPPQNVLERQVLERQIMQRLQVQTAEQNGIRVSESDVDQALERMAQQNNMTVPQLRMAVERDGYEFSGFRENMREQLIIERMRTRVAEDRVEVTESEVDIQLEKQPQNDVEYHLANILVSVSDGASPSELEEARAEARRIYRELQAGAEFQKTAIAESDSQNALQGGDIGWRRPGQISSQFAEIVRNLEPGEVSEPIRAAGGFYLIKVLDRRAAEAMMVPEKRARHILIQPDELVTDQAAYEEIRDIRRRIVEGGADFDAVAREHSDDLVTGTKGGDMGWFGPAEYGTRIEQALQGLEQGEISQPFRTEGGWHIIQLLGTRETDRTEEMRRQRARQAITERKRDEEIEMWMRQLRAQAYVDIRLAS